MSRSFRKVLDGVMIWADNTMACEVGVRTVGGQKKEGYRMPRASLEAPAWKPRVAHGNSH